MSSYIPENFKPDQNTLNLLRKRGIFEDFCNHILDDFLIYWNDPEIKKTQKGKKASWQKTFYTWAVRSFQGKPGREWEENKHRRKGGGGLRNDLFESMLDNIKTPLQNGNLDLVKNNPQKPAHIKIPPIPGANQTMTFEQAQAELKKMKII